MALNLRGGRASRGGPLSLVLMVLVLVAEACSTATCADGFVSGDGTCNPKEGTCGTCGDHEFCDTDANPDECSCVKGYEGDPCTFASPQTLILDPDFDEELDEGPWENDGPGGAERFSVAQGRDGVVLLDASVLCNGRGLLQVVEMPSFPLADPLLVEVTYIARDVRGLGVGFDRAWTRLPPSDAWTTGTFCVGQAAYGAGEAGGEVDIRIAAFEQDSDCRESTPDGEIFIDRFTVRPAADDECLPLQKQGTVLNGNADPPAVEEPCGGQSGGAICERPWTDADPCPVEHSWSFGAETGVTEACFDADEGYLASPAVKLERVESLTGLATATTRISVPLPALLESPSLEFWWRGESGSMFDVELGARHVDTLKGTGSGKTFKYCLPPWTHGNVLDLSFSLRDGNADVFLTVDSVAIDSDPDCGDDDRLLDGSFEATPSPQTFWFGATVSSILEQVVLERIEDAFDGQGALVLEYESPGATLGMETYVLVPSSGGDEAPALTFQSRAPDGLSGETTLEWVLGWDGLQTGPVKTGATWQRNVVCLPALWAGRWFRLEVRVQAAESLSSLERVELDAFDVVTVPASECP